jgi:hypothetical protein
MGTLNAILSCLNFLLYIEEAIGKALSDWFLDGWFSRNIEDRWTGVKL